MFLKLYRAQPPGPPVHFPTRYLFVLEEPKIVFDEVQREDALLATFVWNQKIPQSRWLKSSFGMANCCGENRKIDFNTCNISLAIRASKVSNRTLLSAIINLKVFTKTGTARRWRSSLQVSVSVVHTNSEAPNVNFRKISVRKTIWDLEFSAQFL